MKQTLCPSCGYSRSWSLRRGKKKCKRCRKEFSSQPYPVPGFRLTTETWQLAVQTFIRERSLLRVAAEASVSPRTAQRMTHLFRECMTKELWEPCSGIVEIDETYIGGQRKNKRLHIRRIKTKRGHGTDKLPIVGLFSRQTGKVLVAVEPKKLDIHFVRWMIRENVVRGSSIYTDGFKMYRSIPEDGYVHRFVDHDGGEYVRDDVHTNNIEGFWGILKRKMSCIGGMRRKYLSLFVGEIVWRFNRRTEPLKEQERALSELILLK